MSQYKRQFIVAVVLLGLLLTLTATAVAGGKQPSYTQYLPDIRAVVPAHLNLVNEHQLETLRFSNGIAVTGGGPWALRPDFRGDVTAAIQEIRDPAGNIVHEQETSVYEFHPAHNHWHIGDIALFEVRQGSPTGPVVGGNSIKVTFCLIDWYKLDDNAPSSERTFFDCYTSYQGISVGWVDQYHQSTEGQQLDLTGVPNADDYYLVTTSNPAGIFLESDYTNNTEWVRFRLYQDSNGNRKVEVTDHSPCESPGMCGERSTNR